jgi:hypothetical protein
MASMMATGSRRKFYTELIAGLVLLILAACQIVYATPFTSYYWLKVTGIVLEAAIGIFRIVSAVLLIARRGSADPK